MAFPAVERMGCGTDAEVLHAVPVGRVVAGAEARQGEIRNLVVLEPRSGQRFVHEGVFRFAGGFVHRGELSAGGPPSEGRTGFDGQMVCRNVLHAQREGAVERAAQRVVPETRDAENQVDGDVFITFALRAPHGLDGLRSVVAAVHQLETRVVERLDADRQAVDARAAQRGEVGGGEVVGIGFERGLLRRSAIEQRRGMVQQPRDGLRGAQRGGAAAEVAGAHRLAAQIFPPGVQFAVHGLQKRAHAAQVDAFVEVAVGADALAEGYVEIKSGHVIQRYEKDG